MAARASNVIQAPTLTPDGVNNEGGWVGAVREEVFVKIGRDVMWDGKLKCLMWYSLS